MFAVPVTALIAVVWNYVREQLAEAPAEPEHGDPGPGAAIPS
ncbi:hypothetical protein [Streptomyces sp. AC550_RSS872]